MEEQEHGTQEAREEEIDLLDLLAVLLRRKWLIIGITSFALVAVIAASVFSIILPPEKSFLPNLYTPKALMLINNSSSSSGGLSSMLSSSGLGGLASLAGVNVASGSSYSSLAVYLASTNSFLDSVVDKFDLISRYKIKNFVRATSRKALSKNLKASVDKESGVFSISFTDIDPVFAKDVVNYCVQYFEDRFTAMGLDKDKLQKENLEVNIANTYKEIVRLQSESQGLERSVSTGNTSSSIPSIMLDTSRIKLELDAQKQVYSQLKVQYELLKVTMASDTPVFQVLERAEAPDQKSGPSRGMLCIIVTFAALFGSIFLAFLLNALENIKKDPEAMAKLKGIQK
jgi:uncharacterized protein involved in exopolysaccharide biosynthesis